MEEEMALEHHKAPGAPLREVAEGGAEEEKVRVVATTFLARIVPERDLAIFSLWITSYITKTQTKTQTVTSWYRVIKPVVTALTVTYRISSPIKTQIVEIMATRYYLSPFSTVFLGVGKTPPKEKAPGRVAIAVP